MKKILIVDDEKNIRLTLKQSLSSEKYDIDIALNGTEALKKIKNDHFDLVLLDIKMPGLSGMEVLEKIRHFNQHINVIMITAYGTIEQAVEAMKLGAIDFVNKPFTPQEIKKIINEVFNREELNLKDLSTYHNMLNFAKKCIIDKQYNKATEYLNKAMTFSNNEAEPHNLLGNIYEVKAQFNDALNEYRIALEIEPSNKQAMSNKNRLIDFLNFRNRLNKGKNE